MIEINNLIKVYKNGTEEVSVLKNINLTILDGQFISIVGQSGSGKSTLMNIIGGLTKATTGTVKYNYKDIGLLSDKELSKYRRNTIGFVFQDFNLEGNETVLENIMSPMIFAGVSILERKRRAVKALEKVNLKDKMHCKANTLSGGQKQRVAIARALINNPKIILADEPTGNLDSKNSDDIMNLLKSLNKQGYTVIMVTHDMEQSYQADTIIKIKDGEIIQTIDTREEFSLNLAKEQSKKESLEIDRQLKVLLDILNNKEIESLFSKHILNGTNAKINLIKNRILKEIKNNKGDDVS